MLTIIVVNKLRAELLMNFESCKVRTTEEAILTNKSSSLEQLINFEEIIFGYV